MKILKTVILFLVTVFFSMSCKKEMSYEGGNTLTGGTWQFVNSTILYGGNIDSATIRTDIGTKILTLAGKSISGGENFQIRLYATDSFTTSSYSASLSQSDFDYFTSSKTIFKADVLTGEFTVNITSLSDNRITGTFSGSAEDSSGAQTQITLGIFTSAIDLSKNGSGGATSLGTLGANADTCTAVLFTGNYIQGIPFSALNTVQVQVNVTTPGTFVISTNSVNGVNFSTSGTFVSTGLQNIVLAGSGMPQNAGAHFFTVTYGTSNCIFTITFLPATTPIGDYFPTTVGSSWAYGFEGGFPVDSSSTEVLAYAPTFGGNTFASFVVDEIPPTGNGDTIYYRKSAHNYFSYGDISNYFLFDDPVNGEYIFLNDTAAVGTIFRSPDFNGTIGGVAATGFIQAAILQKGVSATIGSLNFSDVIKVNYQYFLTALPGTPQFTEVRWFARGVGLIYDNFDNLIIEDIARYNVL